MESLSSLSIQFTNTSTNTNLTQNMPISGFSNYLCHNESQWPVPCQLKSSFINPFIYWVFSNFIFSPVELRNLISALSVIYYFILLFALPISVKQQFLSLSYTIAFEYTQEFHFKVTFTVPFSLWNSFNFLSTPTAYRTAKPLL